MIRNFLNGYLHLHQGWAGSDFLKNSEPGSGAKPKFFARPGRERDREFNFPRSGIGIGIGNSIFRDPGSGSGSGLQFSKVRDRDRDRQKRRNFRIRERDRDSRPSPDHELCFSILFLEIVVFFSLEMDKWFNLPLKNVILLVAVSSPYGWRSLYLILSFANKNGTINNRFKKPCWQFWSRVGVCCRHRRLWFECAVLQIIQSFKNATVWLTKFALEQLFADVIVPDLDRLKYDGNRHIGIRPHIVVHPENGKWKHEGVVICSKNNYKENSLQIVVDLK